MLRGRHQQVIQYSPVTENNSDTDGSEADESMLLEIEKPAAKSQQKTDTKQRPQLRYTSQNQGVGKQDLLSDSDASYELPGGGKYPSPPSLPPARKRKTAAKVKIEPQFESIYSTRQSGLQSDNEVPYQSLDDTIKTNISTGRRAFSKRKPRASRKQNTQQVEPDSEVTFKLSTNRPVSKKKRTKTVHIGKEQA